MEHDLMIPPQCACPTCVGVAPYVGASAPQFAATGNYRLDALLFPDTSRWNDLAPLGSPVAVSYSFLAMAGDSRDAFGFATMNELQRSGVRAAFAAWEAVANIHFVELSTDGDIQLGTNYQGFSSAAYAYRPGPGFLGDIYLNNFAASNSDMSGGSYGFLTVLHEIGHAIGLKHPGDYNGTGAGTGPFLPPSEDHINNTVMSYYDFGYPYPQAPRPYDVEAIQYLYGVERDTGITYAQSGDRLLTTGGAAADTLIGINRSDVMTGGEGADTFFGQDGDDVIYGNRGADSIEGNAGNDTLYGGQNQGPVDPDGILRQGVETIRGAAGDDVIYGNHGADLIYGDDGRDLIRGGREPDTIFGGAGDDTINGDLDADSMVGGSGNDVYYVNTADDVVVERVGGGNDTIYAAVQIVTPANVETVIFTNSPPPTTPPPAPPPSSPPPPPPPSSDDYPASVATTGRVLPNGNAPGTVEISFDHDWFKIDFVAYHVYGLGVSGRSTGGGTLSDPVLTLRGPNGEFVGMTDDDVGLDPVAVFVPFVTTTFHIDVYGFGAATGTYRVETRVANGAPASLMSSGGEGADLWSLADGDDPDSAGKAGTGGGSGEAACPMGRLMRVSEFEQYCREIDWLLA